MADCVLFTSTGLHIPVEAVSILGDFNICDPEEGRFNVWNQSFIDGDPGKTAVFHSFFPHVLEVARSDYTRRDATVLGVTRTLSRIGRIFLNNLPEAEARDFLCCFDVFENLRKKTLPSDHAAGRLVIQKPTHRGDQNKHIPSWMSKHPILGSISQQLHNDHRFSPDPFCALAESRVLLHKAKKMTKRELSRQTLDCIVDEALDRFYCFACLSKSTAWDTHAML